MIRNQKFLRDKMKALHLFYKKEKEKKMRPCSQLFGYMYLEVKLPDHVEILF